MPRTSDLDLPIALRKHSRTVKPVVHYVDEDALRNKRYFQDDYGSSDYDSFDEDTDGSSIEYGSDDTRSESGSDYTDDGFVTKSSRFEQSESDASWRPEIGDAFGSESVSSTDSEDDDAMSISGDDSGSFSQSTASSSSGSSPSATERFRKLKLNSRRRK